MSEMVINSSGSVVTGEVRDGVFIVQHGPDFDASFEVYSMDEVSPVVQSEDEVPDTVTELDGWFPDAVRAANDCLEYESECESYGEAEAKNDAILSLIADALQRHGEIAEACLVAMERASSEDFYTGIVVPDSI